MTTLNATQIGWIRTARAAITLTDVKLRITPEDSMLKRQRVDQAINLRAVLRRGGVIGGSYERAFPIGMATDSTISELLTIADETLTEHTPLAEGAPS